MSGFCVQIEVCSLKFIPSLTIKRNTVYVYYVLYDSQLRREIPAILLLNTYSKAGKRLETTATCDMHGLR